MKSGPRGFCSVCDLLYVRLKGTFLHCSPLLGEADEEGWSSGQVWYPLWFLPPENGEKD